MKGTIENMQKVYVISAKRTAVGSFLGSLSNTPAVELGTAVVKAVLADSGVAPEKIDEVILGNVLSAGLGQNISRQIALKSGIPESVSAFTVNKVCGSGIKALHLAYQSIQLGEADAIIAGGAESMSQSPFVLKGARQGLKFGNQNLIDTMINDGLWCATNDYHMGITAENVAQKYNLSREEQDNFSALSQQKATKALENGEFVEQIVPIQVKKGKLVEEFKTDEHIKPGTTAEKLAGLRPAFKTDGTGTVTAGNASGINDAAAILLLVSEKFVKENNLKPLAEITGFASAGVDPKIMGIGPVAAVNKLLAKTGQKISDIELFELNEAFAAQSLAVVRDLKINPDIVNVNGGAVAIGHPIGASGARIAVTLLHALKKRNLSTGVASLCIGGGMGIAMSVKMV
ncbi:MAG: acetyl-CoA C-acetyltransferase [Candidatus Gastranaerophilaceae bacterium]|jgi:acetyl-CoA C-acetyltransferase